MLSRSLLGREDIAARRQLVRMAREASGQPRGDHWTTLPVVVVTGALSALRLAA